MSRRHDSAGGPSPPEAPDVPRAVAALNALRQAGDPTVRAAAERVADALFDASHHLIAYGSLVPGGSNAGQLDGLRGTWRAGWVTGVLAPTGWGAAIGYPALCWSPDVGTRVRAHLFASPDLPDHWSSLDAFEGDEYRRILAPIFDDRGLLGVGYLYESAAPRTGP